MLGTDRDMVGWVGVPLVGDTYSRCGDMGGGIVPQVTHVPRVVTGATSFSAFMKRKTRRVRLRLRSQTATVARERGLFAGHGLAAARAGDGRAERMVNLRYLGAFGEELGQLQGIIALPLHTCTRAR